MFVALSSHASVWTMEVWTLETSQKKKKHHKGLAQCAWNKPILPSQWLFLRQSCKNNDQHSVLVSIVFMFFSIKTSIYGNLQHLVPNGFLDKPHPWLQKKKKQLLGKKSDLSVSLYVNLQHPFHSNNDPMFSSAVYVGNSTSAELIEHAVYSFPCCSDCRNQRNFFQEADPPW